MKRARLAAFPLALMLTMLGAVSVSDAVAARLTPADKAWIATCVADRKASKAKPAALRKYCACMHAVVEDNRPFEITELERTYPPVHQQCWNKHRR